jgi:ubiquinone/menaquinone biosynthesis C-methylase UbiE
MAVSLWSPVYRERRDQLLDYAEHVYRAGEAVFDREKVSAIIESGADREIFKLIRTDYQSTSKKVSPPESYLARRAENRASDVMRALGPARPEPVYMDFGGADGRITAAVGRRLRFPRNQVLCVDLASWENMHHDVERAKFLDQITFVPVEEGTTAIPVASNSVGVSTVLQVLHHMADPEETIRELYRVMRRGGYVFVREHDSEGELDDKMFDIIHNLYEIVTADKENWNYLDTHQPVYHSGRRWIELFENTGFQRVSYQPPRPGDSNKVCNLLFRKR